MLFADSETSWLSRFFDTPNDLHWEALTDARIDPLLRDELSAWLDVLTQQEDTLPLLLPRLSAGKTRWYACSADPQTAAQVREEMEALVAYSYAYVEAYPTLDLADPCECALLDRFGRGVCTVDVLPGCQSIVLQLLRMYRQLVLRRPKRPPVGGRPVGRMRLNFDKALLARQFDVARALIEEIKGSGRLSLQNQRFLEIRLLAAQEQWNVILGNAAYLRAVIDLPLPRRIVADLIEALYQRYLLQFEYADDASGAVESFRKEIRPKYAKLFRARNGVRTHSVLKSFLLNELCAETPDAAHCARLVDEYPTDAPGYLFARDLAGMAQQETALKDAALRAKEAFDDDRPEVALELYATCEPDPEILKQVIRCLVWAKAPEDRNRGWRYCQSCPPAWLETLPARLKDVYRLLEESFQAHRIGDWCEWVRFILNGGDLLQAEAIVQQEAGLWSLDEFVASEGKISEFCSLLAKGMDSAPNFFQMQFSVIYEFVTAKATPLPQLRSLYGELLQLLALSDYVSESDLILSLELIRSLFEVGVTPEIYQDAIDAVSVLWDKAKSPQHLDWSLEIAEVVALNARPKEMLGLTFFLKILQFIEGNRHRVDDAGWFTLEMLGRDFGAHDYIERIRPAAEIAQIATSGVLRGKKVGIYSLTEPVALRAKRFLEHIYPGVIVGLNHDHESTQALVNLAKSSDIFVFAWRSSKHQAYYCVKDLVPKERLILPNGKGSTIIVRSVASYLQNNLS